MDSSKLTQSLFDMPRALVGMLHLGALPASPAHRSCGDAISLDRTIARVIDGAKIYRDAGLTRPSPMWPHKVCKAAT
jgi:predicted TIM-barrel enzyme